MRYTPNDYDRASFLLKGRHPASAALPPYERNLLDAVRTAYLFRADVPLAGKSVV